MLAVWGQRDRADVIAAAEQPRNDEIRMSNDELMTKPKRVINERSHSQLPTAISLSCLAERNISDFFLLVPVATKRIRDSSLR